MTLTIFAKNKGIDNSVVAQNDLLHHFAFNSTAQPNIICTVNNRKILTANKAACKLLGYSKKELLTKSVEDIFDIKERSLKKMLKQRAAEGQSEAEVTITKKSGTRVPCQITSAVFIENGVEKSIITLSDMRSGILKQKNVDAKKEKIVAENIVKAKLKQKSIDAKKAKVVANNILLAISKQIKIDANNAKIVASNILLAISKQLKIDDKNKKIVADNIALAISRQKNIDIKNAKLVADNILAGIAKQIEIDSNHAKTVAENITLAELRQKKIDAIYEKRVADDIVFAKAISDGRLAEKDEKFRMASAVSADVIWDWNLLTDELYFSDRFEELFGYAIKDNKGDIVDWSNSIHPDDREAVEQGLKDAIESSAANWAHVYNFIKADGSIATIFDKASILRTPDGKAYRMIGAMEDVSKHRALEEKLQQEIKLKERQIAEAMEEAKETERSAMGRELHDNVNQLLGASKLFIEMARQGGDKGQGYLERSTEYTQLAIEEIRKLSKGLPTDIIKKHGLCEAINNIVQDTMELSPLKVSCVYKKFIEGSVNEKFKLNIYRIVQEQMNNILKHANATKVDISLSQKGRSVSLGISDNGNGFDTNKKQDGNGISNIKSRAASYKGKAVFISQPGKGCGLTVTFPDDVLNQSHSGFFHESEAEVINVLHHNAFDNSLQPNIIAAVNSGHIIAVNSAVCKLLGYSKEELLKNNRTDIFNINETNFKKMLKQRSTFGQATAFVKAIKKNGKLLPCLITSAVFTGEDGIEKSITTIVDMSDIILKQKNIDTKKEKIVANNIEIAISNQKNIDTKNEKIVADNIEIAISNQKNIDVANQKIVADNIEIAKSNQKNIDIENQKIVADNIEIAISNQKNIDVENRKIVLDNINLAEAKSNAKLTENNQNFLWAAKLSFDIIWDWDILTNEILVGDGFKELFGFTVHNNRSNIKEWLNHIHPDDKQVMIDNFNAVIESSLTNWECNYKIIKADGSIANVFVRANVFRNEEGKAYRLIGALQDISERNKLETEKELIIQELMKSNADLQQFSFIISHNLRSPLSNIQSILKIIDYESLHSDNAKMLRLLNTSGKQLTRTIDDLTRILVIKNNINSEMNSIGLPEVFINLYKTFFTALESAGAKVFTDFKNPNIYFNASYLESILINLFSNAIKYRSAKRDLIIQASSKYDNSGNTIFKFSDNGSGIDTIKHKDRIFGLYQRFHHGIEGQGLGLYIIKTQIEALKGKIEIESEPDKGTTFIITFRKKIEG